MNTQEQIINQTKKWITDVVIGCNFCPFAAAVLKQQSAYYRVVLSEDEQICLDAFLQEVHRLDEEETIETSFAVFPQAFTSFDDYLDFVTAAEELLIENGYEGIYQVASFHPQYLFADAAVDDAANYTNRSVYPMLHLLREASIDKALEYYSHPEEIPIRNVNFAREKGVAYMKMLRDACT